MAYVLMIDQLERWVMAERQAMATLMAAGADVELPNPVELRREFDAELAGPFVVEREAAEMTRWREAVGLAG